MDDAHTPDSSTQQRPPDAGEAARIINRCPGEIGVSEIWRRYYAALDAYTKRVEAERDEATRQAVQFSERLYTAVAERDSALAREARLRELLRKCRYGAHPGSQLAADVEEALRDE